MRSCRGVASTPLIAWMLTAGRTPPTPPRLLPLPVLLAASTQTPPTDPPTNHSTLTTIPRLFFTSFNEAVFFFLFFLLTFHKLCWKRRSAPQRQEEKEDLFPFPAPLQCSQLLLNKVDRSSLILIIEDFEKEERERERETKKSNH